MDEQEKEEKEEKEERRRKEVGEGRRRNKLPESNSCICHWSSATAKLAYRSALSTRLPEYGTSDPFTL